MHLTLLVPELIWPEPADQFTFGELATPGLAWLLAHAALDRQPRCPFETALAACFGLTAAPFGALRLLGDGDAQASSGHWLCADPVHLRFHQERIILADAGAFDLDDDEAGQLIAALNAEFADIGQFHHSDARHWYLRLNAAVDHAVEPISAVAGRRVSSELPAGDSTLSRWLNEVQMFLHGHPVNERRQAAGKPAINSLWLWGGGSLDEAKKTGDTKTAKTGEKTGGRPRFSTTENRGLSPVFSSVWTDQPLAAGLALSHGLPLHRSPERLADVLAQGGERPLLVVDQLLSRVLYEDGDGWRRALRQLDADLFEPLKNALGRQVDRIDLLAPTIYGELRYTLTGGERWKFWKSSRPLPAIAEALAGKATS